MREHQIGYVSNYFGKIHVAAVELTDDALEKGDMLHFHGHTTDCETMADSIEIDHHAVAMAGKGASVGVKVMDRVRRGDKVFKEDEE